jgi:hypothetical protein
MNIDGEFGMITLVFVVGSGVKIRKFMRWRQKNEGKTAKNRVVSRIYWVPQKHLVKRREIRQVSGI